MNRLPTIVTVSAIVGLLLHGPVLQFADYHAFADQRVMLGVPHALDVRLPPPSASMSWRSSLS